MCGSRIKDHPPSRLWRALKRLWNRSGDSERNELGPIIGSKQISDSPMSGLKEDIMAKKKTAKKKTKK
jgi:hypothetical protein